MLLCDLDNVQEKCPGQYLDSSDFSEDGDFQQMFKHHPQGYCKPLLA